MTAAVSGSPCYLHVNPRLASTITLDLDCEEEVLGATAHRARDLVRCVVDFGGGGECVRVWLAVGCEEKKCTMCIVFIHSRVLQQRKRTNKRNQPSRIWAYTQLIHVGTPSALRLVRYARACMSDHEGVCMVDILSQ